MRECTKQCAFMHSFFHAWKFENSFLVGLKVRYTRIRAVTRRGYAVTR